MKIRETPIKMDDLGVALFLETPIYIYTHTLAIIWLGGFKYFLIFFRGGGDDPF